jgi:hypothetical protein
VPPIEKSSFPVSQTLSTANANPRAFRRLIF